MDIRTPEYPQIFDFMIISLFVVDLTPICGGITAEAFLPPRIGSVDLTPICGAITARQKNEKPKNKVDLTQICGEITAIEKL